MTQSSYKISLKIIGRKLNISSSNEIKPPLSASKKADLMVP